MMVPLSTAARVSLSSRGMPRRLPGAQRSDRGGIVKTSAAGLREGSGGSGFASPDDGGALLPPEAAAVGAAAGAAVPDAAAGAASSSAHRSFPTRQPVPRIVILAAPVPVVRT